MAPKIRVFLLGEEPGGEVHRDDRDDQYDTGDKACPDWKMVPLLGTLPPFSVTN